MPCRRHLLVALIALPLAGCSRPVEDYAVKVAAERSAKDEMFRASNDSPLKPEDRDTRLPLSYFPIDETYAVPAQLAPAAERTTMRIPTSTGKLREMEQVGELRFTLNGQLLKLSTFLEPDGRLFVPFTDLTAGAETYPAGRYLDLDPTATGIYVVDFNEAYHPYCYYNAEYDCPFPPAENRLPVPIRAGERLPPAEATIP
ncbi:MAG: DUF1684 domain-containing protein [Acidobacteria bacterium]|nr:DUF1684 domain-containing protein [Acidobacteriota bacterium]